MTILNNALLEQQKRSRHRRRHAKDNLPGKNLNLPVNQQRKEKDK
jgi:hypothetical protein